MRATLLTLIALAAAACGLILAPAGLASAESAVVTIGQLQAQGFDVKIDRSRERATVRVRGHERAKPKGAN